jgi:hypothetical protein
MRRIFTGALVLLLLIGCVEDDVYIESQKLSDYVSDNWGTKLSKLSVTRLKICSGGFGGGLSRGSIQEGGCSVTNKKYYFDMTNEAKYIFSGVVLENNNGKWLVYVGSDLERSVSLESAKRILDWVLSPYVDEKNNEAARLSSWDS